MPSKRITRRDFLKAVGAAAALGAAHGCGPPEAPPAEPTEALGVTPGVTEVAAPTPTPGPKYGGTLKIMSVQDYPSLDPHKVVAMNGRNMFDGLWNGLTKYDPMQVPVPDLAHSWDVSDDGTVYTFYLHEGVKFHNGREMTADDVKFSFDRILDPEIASPFGREIPEMAEVEMVDRDTVRVHLSSPVAWFLGFLTYWKIVAQENVDEIGNNAVGTGPFKLEEYLLGDRLSMVRFDDYWEEGIPYLDEVVLYTMKDVTAAFSAFKAGEFDVYWKQQGQTYAEVEENPDLWPVIAAADEYNVKVTLKFDCKTEDGIFANKKARQALAYALDKDAIAQVAYFGYARANPYGIIMGDDNEYFNAEGLTRYDYDLDEAARLFEEAGASPGDVWEYNAYSGDPEGVNLGVMMKESLQQIGYGLEVIQRELGAFKDRYRRVPAPNVISWGGSNGAPDPSDLFRYFLPDAHEGLWQPSAELDDLMVRGRSMMDVGQRKEVYHEIEKALNDELPYLFPVHYKRPGAAWIHVRDLWQEHCLAFHYREAWLDS